MSDLVAVSCAVILALLVGGGILLQRRWTDEGKL